MPSVGLRALLVAAALLLSACSSMLPSATPAPATPASDPTPLSKCHVAASASSPLVTEWPASEKAHLQSLSGLQTIAVAYSGCELRIVDACQLPGRYSWSRTTLATDTVEIENADELYAKLPIGAVGLEGELARSGRLAVRTTVAGQLRSEGMVTTNPDQPACAEATHFVSAISIGSFQLLSGSDASSGGRVDVGVVGGGAKASRKESVLREAGSREACNETTDAAPSSQCASPIQVFLSPIAPKAAKAGESPADASRAAAVLVSFPPPQAEDEIWTLRAPGGKVLCSVPCSQWIGPVSGDYLQREPRNGASVAHVDLPQAFAHPVGSHVTAEYQAERGNPMLSKWALWGAIPVGASGVGLTAWGIGVAASGCSSEPDGCFPPPGFLIGFGAVEMVMGGVGIWWYVWSREEKFVTYEELSSQQSSESGVKVMLTPNGLAGSF
ncbi:MAG TPA: hypothetical protein VGP93_14895 [Polyangiaceae bacterium]|nr:hypothetical protein [Polyangiaceae bacterium]